MATWLNINSQDSASPLMEQLEFFHSTNFNWKN